MLSEKLDGLDLAFIRKREDEAATQGFISGVVLGLLLGIVLTLVFAPWRGDETRAAVAHKATDVKDKAVDLVHRTTPFGGSPAEDEVETFEDEVAIEREIGGDPVTA
jgi:gas vesicle protein